MSNTVILASVPIGVLGFLFLSWRRLKEDYTPATIFSFSFLLLAFIILGSLIGILLARSLPTSNIFNPQGLWFWGAFIFGSIGFAICFFTPQGSSHFKMRLLETLEAVGLGFIFLFFCTTFGKSVLFSIAVGILIPLFFIINARYKSFSWYKSGKVGFAGLAVLGIFFLTRAIVALIDPTMISFIGKLDAILSSVVAFIFFLTLYNLGGQL